MSKFAILEVSLILAVKNLSAISVDNPAAFQLPVR